MENTINQNKIGLVVSALVVGANIIFALMNTQTAISCNVAKQEASALKAVEIIQNQDNQNDTTTR